MLIDLNGIGGTEMLAFALVETDDDTTMHQNSLTSPDPAIRPNLYLTGFMGTGKSAVGRRVSHHLGMQFLDSDHTIEASEGLAIPKIFELHGESYFRELERKFIFGGHPDHGLVVSCGGGLIMQPGLLEKMKSMGLVIALYASPETILERVSGDTNRPLLQVPDPKARILELLEVRNPIYREVGLGIITDGRAIHEVADHVIRLYVDRFGPPQERGY